MRSVPIQNQPTGKEFRCLFRQGLFACGNDLDIYPNDY